MNRLRPTESSAGGTLHLRLDDPYMQSEVLTHNPHARYGQLQAHVCRTERRYSHMDSLFLQFNCLSVAGRARQVSHASRPAALCARVPRGKDKNRRTAALCVVCSKRGDEIERTPLVVSSGLSAMEPLIHSMS